jgi:hypothetical protein
MALDEVLCPTGFPRYLASRLVLDGSGGGTQRSQAGRDAAAQASAEQSGYSTSRRDVWV